MKTNPHSLLRTSALLASWLVFGGLAFSQGTPPQFFTYQGRLTVDGGLPDPSGRFDLLFRLFDAGTGGTPVGGVLGPCEVETVDGLFSEKLDFGANAFNGQPRWLEVAMRPTGALNTNFTVLTPRQEITWIPYASFADAASRVVGPLSAAQLPDAAARLDLNQTFTGTPNFQPLSGAPFAVGSTSRVDRLNADLLDGRDSTNFWERKVVDGVASIVEPGDTPIELRLWNGNYGVLRLDRGAISPNLTYSLVSSSVATGLSGVVYLGGGERARPNRIEADFATILNGRANLIQAGAQFSGILASDGSVIGANARNSVVVGGTGLRIEADSLFSGLFGGFGNVIRTNAGSAGIVAGNGNEIGTGSHFAGQLGGEGNIIEGGAQRAVILGGRSGRIEARAEESAILGGYGNRVSSNANNAVVVGGDRNHATKQFTLAAGRQARANHFGAFVWSDSEAGAGPFASQRDNEFAVKATGGVRFETKGGGLWVDGQRFLPPGGPNSIPDGSIPAAKLADGAVLLELTDDDGAGSGLDADRLDGLSSEDLWRLAGNAGTSPLNNFLGTTDNQPLELRVDNLRALRLQPDDWFICSNDPLTGGLANSPSLAGGFAGNTIAAGKAGSVIAGGGAAEHPCLNGAGVAMPNTITADFASIFGGLGNSVGGAASAIGGGARNTIGTANYSFIANGRDNFIEAADASVILGGVSNHVALDADFVVLGGGKANVISTNADFCVLAGGSQNSIRGDAAAATIGGGYFNRIQDLALSSTVGGGEKNLIQTTARYGTIPGGQGAAAFNYAQQAYAGGSFSLSNAGDAQTSLHVLRRTLSTASTNELFLDGDSATRRMNLPNQASWSFEILVVARTDAGLSAGYRITGVIKRTNAGAAFVGAPTTVVLAEDAAIAAAWNVLVEADTASNALAVKAVASSGGPSRWVATVRTSEVTF